MDKKERNRIACKKYRESAKGKAKMKEYNKKVYNENKELSSIRYKKWYEENKEYKIEYTKQWNKDNPQKLKKRQQTDTYKKQHCINGWKYQGIIHDDWENIYNIYMDTNNCDYCKKQFKNTLDRNLDHNHNITESNNIRGILCRVCNTRDVLADSPTIF